MVRFKYRYFLCETDSEESVNLSPQALLQKIKDSVFQNFGLIGLSKVTISLQIKYYNSKLKLFIIRVARDYQQLVHNALTFILYWDNSKVRFKLLDKSGTIKKL